MLLGLVYPNTKCLIQRCLQKVKYQLADTERGRGRIPMKSHLIQLVAPLINWPQFLHLSNERRVHISPQAPSGCYSIRLFTSHLLKGIIFRSKSPRTVPRGSWSLRFQLLPRLNSHPSGHSQGGATTGGVWTEATTTKEAPGGQSRAGLQ